MKNNFSAGSKYPDSAACQTPSVQARTGLYADPKGVYVHDAILRRCSDFSQSIALVDSSLPISSRKQNFFQLSYADYGDLVQRLAKGLISAGIRPKNVIAIYLFNCWEFCITYHAATLAGAIPTLLNPSYREREVRYQLQNSGAKFLVSDGANIQGMHLGATQTLERIFCTRQHIPGVSSFDELLTPTNAKLATDAASPENLVAALPYSSGTTGPPKGTKLTHQNLVTNVFQFLAPGEAATLRADDAALCFLPLYHIYGLNVVLNPTLMTGGTIVLMPRFDVEKALALIAQEHVTWIPMVPPVMNSFCQSAQVGKFTQSHNVRFTKCGAAPLAGDLARRFTALTGIPVKQGYGMTEASPVTHMGFIEPSLYEPTSVGLPVALTECQLIEKGSRNEEEGELVMRGPQFMQGYWNDPEATGEVLRDGWYWSGDVATKDSRGFFTIVDRLKEMIKFKGFPISPAEVEALLLEHPQVRDCGIVGAKDADAGEVPHAFVVLTNPDDASPKLVEQLRGFVADRLASFKQPRHVSFVTSIPRNPSGKILRAQLRSLL